MKQLLSFVSLFLLFQSGALFTATTQTPENSPKNTVSGNILWNNAGLGYGIHYERLLENEKWVLVCPLSFCFGHIRDGNGRITTQGKDLRPLMTFISPGIRFYPTSGNGIVRYALGLNLPFGWGEGEGNTFTNGTNELVQRHISGIALSNGVSLMPVRHVKATLELWLGFCSDDGVNSLGGPGGSPFMLIGFLIGYLW